MLQPHLRIQRQQMRQPIRHHLVYRALVRRRVRRLRRALPGGVLRAAVLVADEPAWTLELEPVQEGVLDAEVPPGDGVRGVVACAAVDDDETEALDEACEGAQDSQVNILSQTNMVQVFAMRSL